MNDDVEFVLNNCLYYKSRDELQVRQKGMIIGEIRDRARRLSRTYPHVGQLGLRADRTRLELANQFLSPSALPHKAGEFVEREGGLSLGRLHRLFNSSSSSSSSPTRSHFVVLVGMAGSGKSTLADAYARHFLATGSNNHRVISLRLNAGLRTIDANYYDKLIDAFVAEPTERAELRKLRSVSRRQLNRRLNAHIAASRYKLLVVLDDFESLPPTAPTAAAAVTATADEAASFEQLEMIVSNMPPNVRVLVTSRLAKSTFERYKLANTANFVDVAPLSRDQARSFLAPYASHNNATLDFIMQRLGGDQFLPLKLNMMANCVPLASLVERQDEIGRNVSAHLFAEFYANSANAGSYSHLKLC